MTTPVQAMFWQVWRAWRWGLSGSVAYLLLAALVARLLPDILRRTTGGEAFLPHLGTQLALPSIFIAVHLAAVFSLTGGDLKERGYWKTMFVLPVQTRTLVAWPMLWGSLAVAGVWLFLALFVLWPTGNPVPLVWPIAALAAGLTLMQAHSWMPVTPYWLSIVLAIPSLLSVAMIVALVAIFQVPEPIAVAIFLGLLPLTYAACMHSVALARRGEAFDWRAWHRFMAWVASVRKPAEHPFTSAAQAQLWFECRSFAWLLPLAIGMLLPFFTLVMVLEFRQDSGAAAKPLGTLLLMPALLAAMFGFQCGHASFPFLATRPISSSALVRSKFEMALVSTLVAYLPILLLVLVFFARPSYFHAALEAARHVGVSKAMTVLLLVLALPPLLTWKGLVEGLWIGLTGRAWMGNVFAFAIAVIFGCVTLSGLWIAFHPEWHAWLWSLAPWLVGLLLAAKLILAVWVLIALVRWRLVRLTTAGMMVGGWSLIILALCLTGVWLIPSEHVPLRSLLAGAILAIPFSRLAAAPLALDWNRHR
jgi:hypothetical protein